MTGLLLQLADRGVTGINVYYEGGGDSGCIENITYITTPCSSPDEIEIDNWGDSNDDLKTLDSEAEDIINEFANEKILNDIEDWWNNDGGYGNLLICVPSGKYVIYNNVKFTETHDFIHNGNLINKTLK